MNDPALGAVDRMLLATFMDGATVGVYHAGYSLSSRTLDVVFLWLGMAGAPAAVAAFEAHGKAGLESAAREQARLMALIALPAAVGLALGGAAAVRRDARRRVPGRRGASHAVDRRQRPARRIHHPLSASGVHVSAAARGGSA
jgi:hypothetical protein